MAQQTIKTLQMRVKKDTPNSEIKEKANLLNSLKDSNTTKISAPKAQYVNTDMAGYKVKVKRGEDYVKVRVKKD